MLENMLHIHHLPVGSKRIMDGPDIMHLKQLFRIFRFKRAAFCQKVFFQVKLNSITAAVYLFL